MSRNNDDTLQKGRRQLELKPHHCPSSVVATTSVAEYRRLGRYILPQNGSIAWIEFRSGDGVVVCGMPEAQVATRRTIFTLLKELIQDLFAYAATSSVEIS
jgi:hypothetical protein